MTMIMKNEDHITRDMVKNNPDKIFLFGDNLLCKGYGGQAKEMRGEHNAIGIPTKKKPSMTDDSFFTDDELELNIIVIDNAIDEIPDNSIVIVPKAGLGTGRAKLKEKAPQTYQYLMNRLKELGDLIE